MENKEGLVWGIIMVFVAICAVLAFGWITMFIWNCVMPALFGLPALSFVDGVGLYILCRLLFGGLINVNRK